MASHQRCFLRNDGRTLSVRFDQRHGGIDLFVAEEFREAFNGSFSGPPAHIVAIAGDFQTGEPHGFGEGEERMFHLHVSLPFCAEHWTVLLSWCGRERHDVPGSVLRDGRYRLAHSFAGRP
jgi:hypothetical protein